jgi:ribose 5-phosphate isomerase B
MTSTIAIASDHAGFKMKEMLKPKLSAMGYEVVDLGTNSEQSVDYPDIANEMANWLKKHDGEKGILVCGSGLGISMAANRHSHVRAALCHSERDAQMSRAHNDANVICLAGREEFYASNDAPDKIPSLEHCANMAGQFVAKFLTTELDKSNERHAKRVAKMGCLGNGASQRNLNG